MRKGEIDPTANPSHAPKSRDVVATIFGVSGTYISMAKFISEKSLELFNEVKKGNISLKQAKTQILQRAEIVAKVPQPKTKDDSQLTENEIVVKVPQTETKDDSQLTKNDLKKIDELVAFGMNKDNAQEYIVAQKRKVKTKSTKTKIQDFAEVKYRLDKSEKEKLKLYAQQHGKSMSEVFRELVKKIELE